jgi:hypothetical protein
MLVHHSFSEGGPHDVILFEKLIENIFVSALDKVATK